MFSKESPQDGFYHQRQIILRNTASAHQGFYSLLMIGWAWRKSGSSLRRILPLSIVAVFLIAAFALSGIFSSRVTTDNANEVLLSGKKCGIFSSVTINDNTPLVELASYASQRSTAYLGRSLQCYSNSRALKSENCRPYIKTRLPYTIDPNASCPFDDSICRTKSNLLLDTGLLNSRDHLGLNAPEKKRFHFRSVVHCAPLVTDGFTKVHTNSNSPRIPIMRYYYGKESRGEMRSKFDESFTYQVPINFSMVSLDNFTFLQGIAPDYMIGAKFTPAVSQETVDMFKPTAELNRSDATLWLMFLSAPGVAFYNSTNDPWFSANKISDKVQTDPFTGETKHLLSSDLPAGVLGCTTQTQFCTSNITNCEPLDAADAIYLRAVSDLWSNSDDQAALAWAKSVLLKSTPSVGDFFTELGVTPLLARSMLSYGLQLGHLPVNQWQKEIEHLFQAQLVSFQDAFVLAANGPFTAEMEADYVRPNGSSQVQMCQNQKIYSALYYSFNVVGLSIILVIGTLVITLDFSIVLVFTWIDKQRKHPRHTYSRLEWHINSTLQLQRLAHEELGLGTWKECTSEVPITEREELLALLDIRDVAHPRLMTKKQEEKIIEDPRPSNSIDL